MYRYECPDCRSPHDEPAEAIAGFRTRCLDCEFEAAYRLDDVFAVARVQRAA